MKVHGTYLAALLPDGSLNYDNEVLPDPAATVVAVVVFSVESKSYLAIYHTTADLFEIFGSKAGPSQMVGRDHELYKHAMSAVQAFKWSSTKRDRAGWISSGSGSLAVQIGNSPAAPTTPLEINDFVEVTQAACAFGDGNNFTLSSSMTKIKNTDVISQINNRDVF